MNSNLRGNLNNSLSQSWTEKLPRCSLHMQLKTNQSTFLRGKVCNSSYQSSLQSNRQSRERSSTTTTLKRNNQQYKLRSLTTTMLHSMVNIFRLGNSSKPRSL